jgi:hypothetical protein
MAGTMKDAIYEVVHRSKKPLKQIAEETGMSVSYLTRAALPDQEESENGSGCSFPLKKLVPVTLSSDNYAIVNHILYQLGWVGIPLPKGDMKLSDACRLSIKAVKEFGELMAEVGKGLSDGRVDDQEFERIRKEGYHALQAVNNLLACLEKNREEN